MAAALGGRTRIRGRGRSLEAEVLLPRDVRVSLRPRPHGARPQLHHRRRDGAHEADARLQRAASVRLGCVRSAGGERRHQERHPSRGLDARQHRAHEGAAAAPRHQLRLGARARHLRRRVLQVEPVALHPDVRARASPTAASRRSTGARWTTPSWPTSRSSTASAGAATRRSRRAISSSGSSASPPTPTSCSTPPTR